MPITTLGSHGGLLETCVHHCFLGIIIKHKMLQDLGLWAVISDLGFLRSPGSSDKRPTEEFEDPGSVRVADVQPSPQDCSGPLADPPDDCLPSALEHF